ncbi:hypothetical protein HPB47_017330 [Ixodes persulcatus]|uniref:Uncharacterized protein n=1 Tax=Ixodes persulcatus TaxID=34615 RepID=A0AC60QNJ5_IXOPE|nr:hypothetical protein HPB47_017330 [Ixodes persulcatus]
MNRNRKTRGIVRSAVTRTLTQIDNFLQDDITTGLELGLQLDYLLQKESDLIHLDRDIQTTTSDDDLEDELEGAEEYRLRISHSLTRVRHALDFRVSVPQPTNSMPNVPLDRTYSGGLPPTPTSMSHRTVALPKLQVTTFAGSPCTSSLVCGTTQGETEHRTWAIGTPRHLLLKLLLDSGSQRTGFQAADIIPAGAQGRVDNDVGVLIGSDFYWQVVHIEIISILVAEKAELQSALSQSQQTAKQKALETEELQGRLKAYKSSKSIEELKQELSELSNKLGKKLGGAQASQNVHSQLEELHQQARQCWRNEYIILLHSAHKNQPTMSPRIQPGAAVEHLQPRACCSDISGSLTAGIQASDTLTSGAFLSFTWRSKRHATANAHQAILEHVSPSAFYIKRLQSPVTEWETFEV